MYSISPRLTNNFSTNEELNNLLSMIDKKIGTMAICEYDSVRFGFQRDIDLDLYDDLLNYKEILLDKLLGCNCLDDAMLISINNKVRKLTR